MIWAVQYKSNNRLRCRGFNDMISASRFYMTFKTGYRKLWKLQEQSQNWELMANNPMFSVRNRQELLTSQQLNREILIQGE
jgi:hypothetical protein